MGSPSQAVITESSSIGAVSHLGVQLFQYFGRAHELRSSTDSSSTLIFHTKHFLFIPSFQFLCPFDTNSIPASHSQPFIDLSNLNTDMKRFRALERVKRNLLVLWMH